MENSEHTQKEEGMSPRFKKDTPKDVSTTFMKDLTDFDQSASFLKSARPTVKGKGHLLATHTSRKQDLRFVSDVGLGH